MIDSTFRWELTGGYIDKNFGKKIVPRKIKPNVQNNNNNKKLGFMKSRKCRTNCCF